MKSKTLFAIMFIGLIIEGIIIGYLLLSVWMEHDINNTLQTRCECRERIDPCEIKKCYEEHHLEVPEGLSQYCKLRYILGGV